MKKNLVRMAMLMVFIFSCSSQEKKEALVHSAALKKSTCKSCLYSWLDNHVPHDALADRVSAPPGYSRPLAPNGSYTQWLREFPVKPGKPFVELYNGSHKIYQEGHCLVLDIDVGKQDLQQCADAVMRFRAEYLFSTQQYQKIKFSFTSGDVCAWSEWKKGMRPQITNNKVLWKKTAQEDGSYKNFRSYLNMVFQYAGSASLSKELKSVPVADIQTGDVFIQGGFPGHAVQVIDVVENKEGKKLFLLAQSYMPAQDIHILNNLKNEDISPWYELPTAELVTPEWVFPANSLKRFP
ncbi:MAG: DUF4846 domain-containing protein [Cytophagaceae bacterium]|jgi:hypothetical protein|nr:DUF4846 domain-containing protein [Cytophagaceae bacterium]